VVEVLGWAFFLHQPTIPLTPVAKALHGEWPAEVRRYTADWIAANASLCALQNAPLVNHERWLFGLLLLLCLAAGSPPGAGACLLCVRACVRDCVTGLLYLPPTYFPSGWLTPALASVE
jgi:hypothetical protein